jgi:hypothetical protein
MRLGIATTVQLTAPHATATAINSQWQPASVVVVFHPLRATISVTQSIGHLLAMVSVGTSTALVINGMPAPMTGETLGRHQDLGATTGLLILVMYLGATTTSHRGVGLLGSGTATSGMQFSAHTGHQLPTATGPTTYTHGAPTLVHASLAPKPRTWLASARL